MLNENVLEFRHLFQTELLCGLCSRERHGKTSIHTHTHRYMTRVRRRRGRRRERARERREGERGNTSGFGGLFLTDK